VANLLFSNARHVTGTVEAADAVHFILFVLKHQILQVSVTLSRGDTTQQ
jgi:hypothetical protein